MSGLGPVELGADLVRVDDIEASLTRFGDRFIRRIFRADEAAYCNSRRGRRRVASFASRFAAKEAVMKALGTSELAFADVEVRRMPDGHPTIALHGRAAEHARACGISGFTVSLASTGDYAFAVVIGVRHRGI